VHRAISTCVTAASQSRAQRKVPVPKRYRLTSGICWSVGIRSGRLSHSDLRRAIWFIYRSAARAAGISV